MNVASFKRTVYELVDEGKLTPTGKLRWRRYSVSDAMKRVNADES